MDPIMVMKKELESFAKLVQEQQVSWLSTSVSLAPSDATLFVADFGHLRFPFPAEQDLQRLYAVAQPASFGLGREAVLDPSYRSARTLTNDRFAINLRPDAALLQKIRTMLLAGHTDEDEEDEDEDEDASHEYVRAELYRVNIYGPGDFFKPHKDTPQTGTGHFGSLVVCLPTAFSGGAFVLRSPEGEDVRFDWASRFAPAQQTEEAQVIAFASDLEHWIEPVEKGYRVTVTFHLFREQMSLEKTHAPQDLLGRMESREEYRALLKLRDSKLLARKLVAFPLVHDYSARAAKDIVLKGGDASLFYLLEKLRLSPKIMFFYDYHSRYDNECFTDDDDYYDREHPRIPTDVRYLTDELKLYSELGMYEDEEPMRELANRHRVVWARNITKPNKGLSVAGSYGNEPSMMCYNGNVCIITRW